PPLGGEAHRLIDDGRNPSWSWDGKRLVFERGAAIWIADADGSHLREVKGVSSDGVLLEDRRPALSPDGSRIAFFQTESGPAGDLWLIPSAGGEPRRLTNDVADGGS